VLYKVTCCLSAEERHSVTKIAITDPKVSIQSVYLQHFFLSQFEVINGDVLKNMTYRAASWYRNRASCHGPVKHNLRLRLPILGAKAHKFLSIVLAVVSLTESTDRRIRNWNNLNTFHELAEIKLCQSRIKLDLVANWLYLAVAKQICQHLQVEV
jgi:hypothetical protein